MTFSGIFAFFLATVVHLVSLSFILLGFYLFIFKHDSYLALAGALCLFGIAWLARPRLPKLEDSANVVSREDFPYLYSVADQLADAMNVSRIEGIVIDEEFNAAVTQIGWRRKKYIFIGLPLFSLLECEEQTASLAHEFGHLSNGDLSRTFYIGTALYTLHTWYELLRPVSHDEYSNDEFDFLKFFSYYLSAAIAQIPYLLLFLLVHLLYDGSQKGEYLADDRAAKTVGYQYLISAMAKFQHEGTFYSKVRETAVKKNKTDLFEAIKEELHTMPLREKERLSRIAQLETSRLDATHPPTAYRIMMLEKFRSLPSTTAVSKEGLMKMQKELMTQKTIIQEKLVENYRYELNLY